MSSDVTDRSAIPLPRQARAAALAHKGYRPDIDGLRTVAVVPVVLFHAGFSWISGGYVGVDIFFVISGYLITRILAEEIDRGRFSLVGFYERRARRILPALFTMIAVTLALGWVFMMPGAYDKLSKSVLATLAFLSNFWFERATSDYFGPGAEMMPLLHTWSLAVEEQFYIVFPILLWLVLPRGRGLAIATVALLSLASLTWASYLLPRDPNAAFYLPLGRAWELGIGALLALGAVPALTARWLREAVAAAGLAATLFAIFFYSSLTPFPGLTALLPCLGAAALIAAGGAGPTFAGRLLSLPPMVGIGLISYSFYLWHWPVFTMMRHYLSDQELHLDMALAGTALALVLGWLSWAVIERPFRRPPPKGAFTRPQIFAGALAGGVVLAGCSGALFLTKGLPSRFSPELQLIFAAEEDRNPRRDACFNLPPGTDLCRFGDPAAASAPADFLLWGDSHADAIMPGVEAAAITAGASGYFAGRNGCPPVVGVERVDTGLTFGCDRFNGAILAALQDRDDIGTVILMGRWPLIAEGTRPGAEAGGPVVIAPRDAPEGLHRPETNFGYFETAFRDTVSAIRATGREVVIVGAVPEIGWNVPRIMATALRWGHDLPPVPDAAGAGAREARAAAVFQDLAAQDPGIRYIALTPRLCRPDCSVTFDGRPIYFDGDHLNAYGARTLLTPVFAALL